MKTDSRTRLITAVAACGGSADATRLAHQLGHQPDPHALAALQVALPGQPPRLVQQRPGVYHLTAAGLRELARGVNLAAVMHPADADTVGPAGPGRDDFDSYPSIAVAGAQAFLYVDEPGVLVLSLHLDTGEVPDWLIRDDRCTPVQVTVNGDVVFTDTRPALALDGAVVSPGADADVTAASPAEQAFAALDSGQRARLLRRVFEILEYDEEGLPGGEWSTDTTQALGELFNAFGIVFTGVDEMDDESDTIVVCGPTEARVEPLTWTSEPGDLVVIAASSICHRITGVAGRYVVEPTEDGRWRAALVVTDCDQEVREASVQLGDFASDAEARGASQGHETARLVLGR